MPLHRLPGILSMMEVCRLRTSLCLQFKPHHIAAGAIFLAAKFLKVKLPSDGEKVWWQEFDVTPRQLEEVSNQMLELYEQNRAAPPSHGNETEGSSGGTSHQTPVKTPAAFEEPSFQNGYFPAAGTTRVQHGAQPSSATRPVPDQSGLDKRHGSQRIVQSESIDHGAKEPRGGLVNSKIEGGFKDRRHHEPGNVAEASSSRSNYGSERPVEEPGISIPGGTTEAKERNSGQSEVPKGHSPMVDAIKKIDKDKVKAALEKRRKSRVEAARKVDVMDEDDLIERELESGIELAAEDERIKHERHSWSKPYRQEHQNLDHGAENGNRGTNMENAEEGELSLDGREFHSPEPTSRKRKVVSPGKLSGAKEGYDLPHYHAPSSKHRDSLDDSRPMERLERAERDHKRLRPENQV